MPAAIDIINGALTKLGERNITAVTDPVKAARIANQTYDKYRDVVLSDHKWNFAITRLAITSTGTEPLFEFANAFNQPGDLLRLLDLDNPDNVIWKVENGQILTDIASPLNIQYVFRNTNVNSYSFMFIEALEARLAAEWAEPLTKSATMQANMQNLFQAKMRAARSVDGSEDFPDTIEANEWLRSRT